MDEKPFQPYERRRSEPECPTQFSMRTLLIVVTGLCVWVGVVAGPGVSLIVCFGLMLAPFVYSYWHIAQEQSEDRTRYTVAQSHYRKTTPHDHPLGSSPITGS
jgi:hypothetical protein